MSGDSLANPPKLKAGEYSSWAIKFESHVLATDGEVWQIIEQGRQIIYEEGDTGKEKQRSLYTKEDYKHLEKNARAMKVLHAALEPGDLKKVIHLKCPREVWHALKRVYEGSDDVKKNRILSAQMELNNLRQTQNESVHDYHSRFQGCISGLANLNKTYEQWEINHMFLRGLASEWNDIVRTMQALPNTKLLTLEDLVSKLDSNMLLDKDRVPSKGSRQVALTSKEEKSKESKSKESSKKDKGKSKDKEKSDDKESDDIALLTKALKFAKDRSDKGRESGKSRRTAGKDDECFYCKKKGHFSKDCYKKKRDKEKEDKDQKPKEDKKAMFAWGSSDTDSDLESDPRFKNLEKDEVCLMTGKEPAENSEVSSSSSNSSSTANMSRFKLLDIIKQLCDKNDELKDIIDEKDGRISNLFEESYQKSAEIRQLKRELANTRKPTAERQVQEPVRKTRVSAQSSKTSRPGLGYGKVTILKRPENAGKPRSTPQVKVDLHDDAKTFGKGFRIWNQNASQPKQAIDFDKLKKKAAARKKVNYKKQKVCVVLLHSSLHQAFPR